MKQFQNIQQPNSRGEIVLSSIQQLERKSHSNQPSIKVVLSGREQYWVNGRYYNLGLNHYLMVDRDSEVELNIAAKEAVEGICIFPDKSLINEVAKTQLASQESLLENPFENEEMPLIHSQFNYRENKTGEFLQAYIPFILQLKKQKEVFNLEEFYQLLAACIVEDQLKLAGTLKNMSTAKSTTKEELYRRVAIARDFMEANFTEKISLDELAEQALLSKYHFTRSFKALFQLSPYQYLMQLRLQKAQELLAKNYSYNETSQLIGFSGGKNLRKAIKKLNATQN